MSLGHHYHEIKHPPSPNCIKGWARDEIGRNKGDLDYEIYFRDRTKLVFFKTDHDHLELDRNSNEIAIIQFRLSILSRPSSVQFETGSSLEFCIQPLGKSLS